MIVFVDDRETGLQVGYLATDWKNLVSFDVYKNAMMEWKIQTIMRDNQPIGAVYRKDDELHVSVLPAWRCKWITKGVLRELFNRPKIVTRVAAGHDHMYGILGRLGFKQTADNWMVKEN
jgi:hypothetical protein